MAGGSTSEEMDALSFDDVTPPKPVSIYDLDEDLPTRAQTSEEIAEFQRLAREKREAAFRSFPAPNKSSPSGHTRGSDPGSSARPIPRESGPVLIDRLRVPPPAEPDPEMDEVLQDIAASIARLPPSPRVPHIEQPRGSLETIPTLSEAPPPPSARVPNRRRLALLVLALLVAVAVAAAFTFFR